ncbi:Uncharacterized protein TPAR_08559 [Tolypocladium paradoxum]|uniref:Uncharacterized protein n=1 Tax=Tolypocladium paradoxum TaxID=94208 RepID=A0A2S4KM21_9HYPO|nr:Uncharacterized protein TPAR_08559 [Tolypocladium paradoxum]
MGPSVPQEEPGDLSARPLRILVQTKTNLVPGNDYAERVEFMRNLICQHHWNRDFDWHQDRWNAYGDEFGYENRSCYFLIDHCHGESPDNPPVLWYKWTGKSLIAIQQALPAKIQAKLKEYPFSRRPIQRLPKEAPAPTRRQIIRSKLRRDMTILDADVQFLVTHPEDARWLRDNIETRFWLKIQALCHFEQDEGILG